MKNSVILLLLLCYASIYSQTIVRYLSGSYTPDMVSSNILASNINANSGISPLSCSTWLSATDFNQNNLSNAIANGDFWEFTLTPNNGYNINITNITIAANGTNKSDPSPLQQYGIIYKVGSGLWIDAANYNANNLGANICISSTSGTNLNVNINTNLVVAIGLVYYGTTSTVQAKFGTFIVSGSLVLPVELIDFNGNLSNNQINIRWSTASESNNLGFEIQKSENGKDWELIDFIPGFNNTNKLQEYQYQDKNLFSGTNYYRLKQIDFDGVFEYSKIIAVEYMNLEKNFKVFPIPSNGLVNIQINIPSNQKFKIRIADNLGRKVWESELIEGEINWKEEIEILGNGMYFITAQIGDKLFHKRVIISGKT